MTSPLSPAGRSEAHVLWRGDGGKPRRPLSDRPGEILRLLSRVWRNAALYGADHRVVLTALGDLHEALQGPLSSRPSIRLFIHEDTFFVDGMVLLEESLQLFSLLRAFKARKIGALQLDAGVEPGELAHLIDVLNLKVDELERRGGAEAYLGERGVRHIKVGSAAGGAAGSGPLSMGPAMDSGGGGGQSGGGREVRPGEAKTRKVDPQNAYRAGLRVMGDLSSRAAMDLPLNLGKAQVVIDYFIDILNDDSAALLGIATLKNYDEDTYHHSVNVCILSLLIGSQLNLDRTFLVTVGLAALLHDIGKVRVPRNIITKPSGLTPEEQEIVRRHTIYGAHILRELPGLSRLAMVVAFEHHAQYDLSGYPQVTMKEFPHLITRIVWVADCFDAMTSSRRAYRRPKSPEQALKEILDGAGTTYDPVVAKLFCRYWLAHTQKSVAGPSQSPPHG
jgi:putative nucleotidyltransferase with HDIG domain